MGRQRILPLCCLALCLAMPGAAQEKQQCPEAALQTWLSGCTDRIRVRNARRSLPPEKARDPWAILESAEVLVEAGPFLAERAVEECSTAEREDTASAPDVPCEERDRREWLAGCIDEALAFVGKSRVQISAAFRQDGGLASAENVRYFHRRCPNLKLGVTFDWSRDAEGRGEMGPGDTIVDVKPYIGLPFMD